MKSDDRIPLMDNEEIVSVPEPRRAVHEGTSAERDKGSMVDCGKWDENQSTGMDSTDSAPLFMRRSQRIRRSSIRYGRKSEDKR